MNRDSIPFGEKVVVYTRGGHTIHGTLHEVAGPDKRVIWLDTPSWVEHNQPTNRAVRYMKRVFLNPDAIDAIEQKVEAHDE